MKKTNKGITLIALVVTIIVLLILAGVSIATLTGENGILTQVNKSKQQTEIAEVKERAKLDIMDWQAEKLKNGEDTILTDDIVKEEILRGKSYVSGFSSDGTKVITKSGYEIPISELYSTLENIDPETGWDLNKVDKITSADSVVVPVPKGFTVSETDKTVSTGLVIIAPDVARSEFVWVPVASIDTMATNMSGTDENGRDNYQGKLYDFTGTGDATTSKEKTSYGQGTTSYREPSLVTGSDQDKSADVERITGTSFDASSYYYNILGYAGSGYSTAGAKDFGKDMQKDYNAMIESVDTYGGFYIGRYETSISGGTVASKVATPMNATIDSGNTWYGMYKKQKEYASKNNITSVSSSMIWGSQYDAMLNWALTGSDKGKVTATGNGNHNGSGAVSTGATTTDKINNIYDLEGNLREWTIEANGTVYRVYRGR